MIKLKHLLVASLAFMMLINGPARATSETLLRVGLVAPDQGSLSLLGTQLRAGFLLHEQQYVAENARYELIEEIEICESGAGEDTAYALEEAQVDIVVGFLCVESLISALPVLKQNNIPVINVNIRADIVRDEAARLGWPLFSVAPRASDQAEYAAQYILQHWGDKAVALIEDGTIHNREMVDAVRLKLDERGFQPVVLDNFRPGQDKQFGLVRRLAKSNITHIFVGGTRNDTAIIARDAASIDLSFNIAGGDALRAADELVALPDGVVAILADIGLTGPDSRKIRAVFDSASIFPDHFPILGYAMAQIMLQLSDHNDRPLDALLRNQNFTTLMGPVSFDQYGERLDNVFKAMIWKNGSFLQDTKTQ